LKFKVHHIADVIKLITDCHARQYEELSPKALFSILVFQRIVFLESLNISAAQLSVFSFELQTPCAVFVNFSSGSV
jgi:hypothetical protein